MKFDEFDEMFANEFEMFFVEKEVGAFKDNSFNESPTQPDESFMWLGLMEIELGFLFGEEDEHSFILAEEGVDFLEFFGRDASFFLTNINVNL